MMRTHALSSTAAALALVAFASLSCSKRPTNASNAGSAAGATDAAVQVQQVAPSAPEVPGVLPTEEIVRGVSIYELGAKFVDQSGSPSRIDAFRGHPTIVAMFFSSCPLACPRLIANVKALEASLPPAERADLRVLLITIDPENDTPEVLRGVVTRRELDASRWKLLTGKDDDIREAAAVLGVKYRESDGTINHSSVLTLVDREGRVEGRYDGLADARPSAGKRIHELVAQK